MPVQKRTLYGIIAVFVAVIIIVSGIAALYFYQYTQAEAANRAYVSDLNKLGTKYVANVLIDYGNSTKKWYNDTRVDLSWNLYTVTLLVTNGNVNATCCEFGSHFVEGINGVQNTQTTYWWLWTYNSTALWQTAPVGPDEIMVQTNNTVFGWTFCASNAQGNPACTPP